MTDITVVTTFHQPGLDKYGQRFIDSFADKVDQKIKLLVYAENCKPKVNASNIIILDAVKELHKLNAFKERWKDVPKANGIPPEDIKARRPRDWHKEFKWHAIRFANKVYAVFDACERSNGWCVWMDADTFIHSEWSYKDFKKLLPDDKWLTYVGRGKGSQTWPECGFYGMNLNHGACTTFLQEFERMYEDAENGIFKLEEWHDSYVFGHVLENMKVLRPDVLDYSAEMYLKEAKTGGGGHPLINTVLGKWIDHLKGDRKNTGKSLAKDIMVNRKESYWQ
jgi:hypothetical protein